MKSAAILLSLMAFAAVVAAAPATLRPHFTVQLHVQVSDQSKEAVISDIGNEFKKLGDVDVLADGRAIWVLYINVAPIIDQKGRKGYIISMVIADQNASQTLQGLPSDDFKTPAVEKTVKDLAEGVVDIQDHLIVTCAADGLPKAYAQIVNYFNETYLMPVREQIDNYNFDKFGTTRHGF